MTELITIDWYCLVCIAFSSLSLIAGGLCLMSDPDNAIGIHPLSCCITDLVSFKAVVGALKSIDPLFSMLVVEYEIWLVIYNECSHLLSWELEPSIVHKTTALIPYYLGVAIMIRGSNDLV